MLTKDGDHVSKGSTSTIDGIPVISLLCPLLDPPVVEIGRLRGGGLDLLEDAAARAADDRTDLVRCLNS